jgi:hypothetical protein
MSSKKQVKKGTLSKGEITSMVRRHEDGSTIYELADKYGVKPRSVAAFVANAHR